MRLGEGLLLPLGARNALLHAAGFAAAFPASPLDSAAVGPFRAILNEMLARHAPYPAMLVDRHWTVRETNTAAQRMLAPLQQHRHNEKNMVRLLTSGEHVGRIIVNLGEVLSEIRSRLRLEALEAGDDAEIAALLSLLDRCGDEHQLSEPRARRPVLPLIVNTDAGQLRLLSAIAHFGTSEDAAIRDLRLELFFPADDDTREAVARLCD